MIRTSVLCVLLFVAPAFAQETPSIRQMDFKNFSYRFDPAWGDSVPDMWAWVEPTRETAQVINGRHEFGGGRYLEVRNVLYGDVDGDLKEEAIVTLNYGTGGTAHWEYLYIYRQGSRGVEEMGCLQTGSRGSGGLLDIATDESQLILDFADPKRPSGDCCSMGVIHVTYRFDAQTKTFVESSPQQRNALRPAEYTPLPAVSSDMRYIASVRSEREVWLEDARAGESRKLFSCPANCRNPQFSPDAQSVFVVVDAGLTSGALWKIDVMTGQGMEFIPNAATFRVIQKGPYAGSIIADQPTLTESDGTPYEFPRYIFFIFRPSGSRIGRVGLEADDLDRLLAEYSQ